MKGSADALILTCEHGGHSVPRELQPLFRGHTALLQSHRGWDPGALVMARYLARKLDVPLYAASISRLVVDLNRSPSHRGLFSSVTGDCSGLERKHILDRYYTPYRREVEQAVSRHLKSRLALTHVSVHSFTPVLNGHRRNADIGILYNPDRAREAIFAQRLRLALLETDPDLCVRCNYPYRGSADGFTTWLRRLTPQSLYTGIELELNQSIVAKPAARWVALRDQVRTALRTALNRN